MLLRDLISAAALDEPGASAPESALDRDILRITDDSRAVDDYTLFTLTYAGRAFARDALERGAKVLLCESATVDAGLADDVRAKGAALWPVTDLFGVQGQLAAALYGFPARRLKLIAITGTNGKTTVTRMVYHLLQSLGLRAGVIGTLGAQYAGNNGPVEKKTGYTTPRAPELHALLAEMVAAGVSAVALEASSEALALGRLHGAGFAAAGFTNLSIDHLDFHGDMESYYQAKKRLFEFCRLQGAPGIVALADEWGARLAREERAAGAEIIDIAAPFVQDLPAPTQFNRWNASVALAVTEAALGLGESRRADLLRAFASLPETPGRFERVQPAAGADPQLWGLVDYAHSPDALENLLRETRALGARQIIVVFGCGGNRDRGKRPRMGRIAAELADLVFVCDDNPRKEDPAAIRAEILAGVRELRRGAAGDERVIELGDRRAAIFAAAARAKSAASKPVAVVVAGKGHETGQILADITLPFSDRDTLREALERA